MFSKRLKSRGKCFAVLEKKRKTTNTQSEAIISVQVVYEVVYVILEEAGNKIIWKTL